MDEKSDGVAQAGTRDGEILNSILEARNDTPNLPPSIDLDSAREKKLVAKVGAHNPANPFGI
jgi:hypothetical protein